MSTDGTVERVPRVLAADDDPDVLAALKLLLRAEGFELETATSPARALAFAAASLALARSLALSPSVSAPEGAE